MVERLDVVAQRQELAGPVARLIEFLRRLASIRKATVADVGEHERVWWLGRRPQALLFFREAGAGDAILTLDPVASEPSPRVPEELAPWLDGAEVNDSSIDRPLLRQKLGAEGEPPIDPPPGATVSYDRWVQTWVTWAAADRLIEPQREWYESLSKAHQQLDQHSDEFELVIAAGMLGWDPPSGKRVRTHLLTTRAQITVERDTGRIEVLVDADAVTKIADRDLLTTADGFEPIRSQSIREELREQTPLPLGDEVQALLERWRNLALDRSRPYDHDEWEPLDAVDLVPELRFAPALVLKRRDSASLLSYYDQMLDVLSGPDAEAPLGLAQLLVALEPDVREAWLEYEGSASVGIGEDPLFPLPANDEQAQIIHRLHQDSGVVVQGPPGTGKSHSIANLISALLAQGQRVLVTSQKAQALRVLREKLPDEIAELCVSMTDLARGGSAELNRSVNAIAEHFGNHNPVAHAAQVADLVTQRNHERARVATTTEQLRALRDSESYQHPEIAPGFAGTLATISRKLRDDGPTVGWIPVPVPSDASAETPLAIGELGELRHLLSTGTPERKSLASQELPSADALPSAAEVRGWVAAEAAATTHAKAAATPVSQSLAQLGPEWRGWISGVLRGAWLAIDRLGVGRDPDRWDQADWRTTALHAAITRQDRTLWDQLAAVSPRAVQAQSALSAVGLRNVVLPPAEPQGPNSRAGQLAAAQALSEYLRGGGKLRRLGAKPVQKAAEALLEHASVDGIAPTTPELIDVLVSQLEAETTIAALSRHWLVVGLQIDPTEPLIRRTARLVEANEALGNIQALRESCAALTSEITKSGLPLASNRIHDLVELDLAVEALTMQADADEASRIVVEKTNQLSELAGATPDLAAIVSALSGRDADSYEAAITRLTLAHVGQAEQRRCDELYGRLHQVHPAFAQLLERTAGEPEWDSRMSTLPEAWAWARARTFFDAQRQPGLDAELDADLTDATARFEAVTGRLAAAQAWGHTLARMNQTQSQALQAYRDHMTQRGSGTGRYTARYEKAAREAMMAARGAVPAWIMPLPEVLETVPPEQNSFDVVIVDEASQASLEALFLLWLAPRVIVVGDDRQCTPSMVSHGELQPIFESLDEHLPDVPAYLRVAFTPRSSLFSLLTTRFGAVIRLREHFRCMPEIIGWSSKQFYSDSPLIPLRQFGADRLDPLMLRHVPGAYTDGKNARIRNPVEAEAIADQIAACIDDPAYDDMTFGVVVLQGRAQIPLIQDLLYTRIPESAWEQRRLRIGNPPDFQGDERDVIFISMVVAEPPRAVTRLDDQRRFNVAASRARDQVWGFHSVTLDGFSPIDLRHSLVAYMSNPPVFDAVSGLDNVTDNDPHPKFDSLFEQRVFNRIRARGYHVIPQYEVNGRRIDLVVLGANGRLAVECDGDAWHTSPEQRGADLHREQDLKRSGWKFWRVRESEYYFDEEAAMEELWTKLSERGIEPHDTVVPASPVDGEDDGWAAMPLSDEEGTELDFDDAGDVFTERYESASFVPSRVARPSPAGPTSTVAARAPRASLDPSSPTPREVRAWARDQGLAVGERGRLHPLVIEMWNAQNPDRPFRSG